jgi:hypothetical protein
MSQPILILINRIGTVICLKQMGNSDTLSDWVIQASTRSGIFNNQRLSITSTGQIKN